MAIASRSTHSRRLTFDGATLEQAVHRCLELANPLGVIRLMKSTTPERRQFVLDVDDDRNHRLVWTFRALENGTELSISIQDPLSRLLGIARRPTLNDRELERTLGLLPQVMNMKVVVLGGGTGLYTTLLALQGRAPFLSAVISGLPRAGRRRDPKDQMGALPLEDAGLCLVALTPTLRENLVLRALLEHRMRSGDCFGANFGTLLLQALSEMRGSEQGGLDDAAHVLHIAGRIILAAEMGEADVVEGPNAAALAAIREADMLVIAPGHFDLDTMPVFASPGIAVAFERARALKVVITTVMTAENQPGQATTSQQLETLRRMVPGPVDVVLANDPIFAEGQLRAYAHLGARPVIPDLDATARFARRVVVEQITAPGDLARHDPARLGDQLMATGAAALLARGR